MAAPTSRALHEDAAHGQDAARTNTRAREDGESNGHQDNKRQETELFSLVLIFVKVLPEALLVSLREKGTSTNLYHTPARPHRLDGIARQLRHVAPIVKSFQL